MKKKTQKNALAVVDLAPVWYIQPPEMSEIAFIQLCSANNISTLACITCMYVTKSLLHDFIFLHNHDNVVIQNISKSTNRRCGIDVLLRFGILFTYIVYL